MKERIYTTSERAWTAMIAAIEDARESIHLQMYILGDDDRGKRFFGALEDAAKRGVEVIAILDVVGSYDLTSGAVSRLREAGAEVLYSSFFFQRMHRKVLILDGKEAFVGGVNVGKRYARWKDLQVRVTGPVVGPVARSFYRTYRNCGGKKAFAESHPRSDHRRPAQMRFVDHGMGKRRSLMRAYYEERLLKAEKSIVIVTPYLFPPRWLIARLHQALLRGVSVEILLPIATDHWIVNGVNRSFASFLSGLGARCYFGKGMNHAKAILVDSREGIIGSQNLDVLSFEFNIEAGVFFHEPELVIELETVIKGWKAEAEPFDQSKEGKFHWYDIPTAFLLRLFGLIPLG